MSAHRKSTQHQSQVVALSYSLLLLSMKPNAVREGTDTKQHKSEREIKAEQKALRKQVMFEQKQARKFQEITEKPPQEHYYSHYTKRR